MRRSLWLALPLGIAASVAVAGTSFATHAPGGTTPVVLARGTLAEKGGTNGARGTPAGAEKQHLLQRAVEPQFSPFETAEEGEEAVNAAETRLKRFGSDTKGTC